MKQNQRTIIFSFLATIALFSGSYAQQRWSIGPRIGANISKINNSDLANTFIPGFTGGFYVMYSDISHFGVSGDVLFSQKGGKFDYTINNARYTYTQRINYIDVPIMARYFLNLSGNFRPNVFAGGVASFLLNAKQKNWQENNQNLGDLDNSFAFKDVDLSFVAGLGLNFKIAKARWIQTDLRYQQSLVPIGADTPAGAPTSNVFNTSVNLLFSYAIGVGKKYKN